MCASPLPRRALLDPRPELGPVFRASNQRLERGPLAGGRFANEKMIDARRDRPWRQLLDRVPIGDGLHPEVVGAEDAGEADVAAEEIGRDPARQRGGGAGIERWIENVRGHDRLQPGARGGDERRQLHAA